MMHRIKSPYSQIEVLRERRREVGLLILSSILFGTLFGFGIGGLLDLWLDTLVLWGQIAVYAVAFAISLGLLALVIKRFYSEEAAGVRLEVVIPYLVKDHEITVAKQHKYRPRYEPAGLARTLFFAADSTKRLDKRALAEDWQAWQAAHEGRGAFQQYFTDLHAELTDALILFVLHRHSEDSIGPEADYKWWYRVDTDPRSWRLSDLPPALKDNRFVQAKLDQAWKLDLPASVEFTITDLMVKDRPARRFTLSWPGQGHVQITRMEHVWVGKGNGLAGKALGEGLALKEIYQLTILGSLIEAEWTCTCAFRAQSMVFNNWGTGLLGYLEEALDWPYFIRTRPHRMLVDLPWKIGDLPRDGSIWAKLEKIECKMDALVSDEGDDA
jgi:hypothetical protein